MKMPQDVNNVIKNDKSSNFNVLILKMYTSWSLNCLECFEGWQVLSSTDKHRSTELDRHYDRRSGMLLRPDCPSKDLYGKEMIISETYEYKYKNG